LDKEQQILALNEAVQQLEDSRTDKRPKDFKIQIEELEESVSSLKSEKRQITQELEDLKTFYFEEIERIAEHTRQVRATQDAAQAVEKSKRLKAELAENADELKFLTEKWTAERNKNSELVEDLHESEDKIQQLEEELRKLASGLKNRERTIEQLEDEISKEDEGELIAGERLRELQRSHSALTQQIRERECSLRTVEHEKGSLVQQLTGLQREIKRLTAEKKDLQDLLDSQGVELEQTLDQLRLRDDRILKVKEELQREMAQRIMELKQQKLALEERLQEVEDSVDLRTCNDLSFHDELSQLEDFKPIGQTPKSGVRHFTFESAPRPVASPRYLSLVSPRNFVDTKQQDKLRLEVSEKDFLVKTLRGDNDALEEQVRELQSENFELKEKLSRLDLERLSTENYFKALLKDQNIMLTLKLDRLEFTNIECSSELDKVQLKLMKSSQTWAEENNSLRAALKDAETLAYKSRLQYIEAATDRDIYMKRFNELSKERSVIGRLGSIFKRKS
jgi:chromosome segregation ATPase